jgi:hypothetical protein
LIISSALSSVFISAFSLVDNIIEVAVIVNVLGAMPFYAFVGPTFQTVDVTIVFEGVNSYSHNQ